MKTTKQLLSLLFAVTLIINFSSCKKDNEPDYSAQELMQKLMYKYNDLVDYGLFGPVKQMTKNYYYDATMNSSTGVLTKGKITTKYVYDFNTNGFITYRQYYDIQGTATTPSISHSTTYAYNDKNQVTEELEISYSYDGTGKIVDTTYYKSIYTYTDTEATEKEYESEDGNNWTLVATTVYGLDQYGRIDSDNMKRYYPVTQAATNPDYERVEKREKDAYGNDISNISYNVDYAGGVASYYLWNYYECAYLYY